jgi:hypothetical protein
MDVGEIAEMMLDGTLCQVCGGYMDGAGDGFPLTCDGCKRDERRAPRLPRADRYSIKDQPRVQQPGDPRRQGNMMSCPFCVRKVKVAGFGDHMLDFHADKWRAE